MSRPAIRIATLGVAIGVCVMLLSVGIVFGFKHTVRDKVVGFGSHIVVSNFMTLNSSEIYPIQMNDAMIDKLQKTEGVKHVQRFAHAHGILKTEEDFLGVSLKGVAQDWDSTFIHQHLVEGSIPHFSDSANSNKLLISNTIAKKLKIKTGSGIFAYFLDKSGVRVRKFTVAGVYETNLTQYDEVVCFTDLYTCVRLNGWEPDEVQGAEISVESFDNLQPVYEKIAEQTNKQIDDYGNTYYSADIKTTQNHIFAWLDLLDMNVWVILVLMVLVASVTMISGLLIIILERTQMIGTLKALGAGNGTIRRTFLWLGTFIIGKGIVYGNLLALGIMLVQWKFGIVKLDAEVYYVSEVPIEFSPLFWGLINVATLLLSVLVLIIPSFLISHIQPSKAIRFE